MGVEERRFQEREQRKQTIVDAALRVFSEKGIKDATIDDIAKAAELGKGTIYYYFSSKEAILEGAIEATVDMHFEGLFARAGKLKTPYDVAEALLVGCAENFHKNPAMFKVLYMVLAEPRDLHQRALQGFVRRHMVWLEELTSLTDPIFKQHKLASHAFLHFVGTHVHGMMVLASSGRPVDGILKDSLTTLRSVLN